MDRLIPKIFCYSIMLATVFLVFCFVASIALFMIEFLYGLVT